MKKLFIVTGTLLLLTACKSGTERLMEKTIEQQTGGNANVDMNADGSMHVETSEGSFTAGTNEVPKDWPTDAPIFAGATVQYSASVNPADGKPGAALILMTRESAKAVVAFYQSELAKEGWTMNGTMQAGNTTVIGAMKDLRAMSVAVTESDQQTSITIGIEKRE
jgi:hypothetical protein